MKVNVSLNVIQPEDYIKIICNANLAKVRVYNAKIALLVKNAEVNLLMLVLFVCLVIFNATHVMDYYQGNALHAILDFISKKLQLEKIIVL